ncbi:MAG: cysteine desulfurase family protein [Pirellulaceae bacterium]
MLGLEIYLDNNATTAPLPAVRAAMLETLGPHFGNPSSTHTAGDRARDELHRARCHVARHLAAAPEQLTFTSCGTEANNLALHSAMARARSPYLRLVTTNAEHSSIKKMAEHLRDKKDAEVVPVPVDRKGLVNVEHVKRWAVPGTALVSVHWVNNETGVIQPIEQIAELCAARGVPLHVDACQALGKLPINLADLPIDLVTVTAHKIHGPQGAAALYARDPDWLVPLFYGGPQENDRRPGTENVPGIVGFGAAAEIRARQFDAVVHHLTRLRDQFEDRVRELVPDVTINGDTNRRACNTTNLCFHGLDGQALVARLDQQGVRCSQSSACTNQRPEPSYVLRAMGLSEEDAYASIRFSFGVTNTEAEVETAALLLQQLCGSLRAFASNLHNPYHANRS